MSHLKLEKPTIRFQDELLEDTEVFQQALQAFRAETERGSDRCYTLYGELYASLTQLISSAEATQEQMDRTDDLKDLLDSLEVVPPLKQ